MNHIKFIDPRIDFAFKKIFGSEDAKDVLISFLESLLGLNGDRCIAELTLLDPFLAPRIQSLKSSVLDVRCKDQRGVSYVVEMQMERMAGFIKRIQYNSSKAYVGQISKAENYPKLNQVIAVTIDDFIMFHDFDHYISCHENRETITGNSYLNEIVHYFVELPKFNKTLNECSGIIDKWIYFIKYAGNLDKIPEQLNLPPFRHAFEKAMVANMTADELELYDKAGLAIADAKGRLDLAREEGKIEGKAEILLRLMQRRFGSIPKEVQQRVTSAHADELDVWSDNILDTDSLQALFH
ncbi:MAG: Rpn family recombination-promoting nuclease/putative transposase [Magnetococcales bacterium]|nr:Rpn family recombination-promoting nuclease/putative transposase [Magnetococcales bacterium]